MFNDRLQALRIVLARSPKLSLFTINDDGSITNKARPGHTYSSIGAAMTDMNEMKVKIADFRNVWSWSRKNF